MYLNARRRVEEINTLIEKTFAGTKKTQIMIPDSYKDRYLLYLISNGNPELEDYYYRCVSIDEVIEKYYFYLLKQYMHGNG